MKTILDRIKTRFIELWHRKIFRYAVIVHLFYFVLSYILVIVFFRDQNDFLVYYSAGGVFLNDIENLYNQDKYLWAFRYFPVSAIIFVPFYILGFNLGFTVFHIINLLLNVLICGLIYKIIPLIRAEDHETNDNRAILYISLYLMSLPQMFNYVLGQINLYVTFLMLWSLYIFFKHNEFKWQFIASIILGFSIIVKPIALFIVPFLIIIQIDLKAKKINFNIFLSFIRVIGSILPLSLNLIVFGMYPKLWAGFVNANFTGTNPVDLNFSFSITKLIINFYYFYEMPFRQLYVIIIVFVMVGVSGYVIFILKRAQKNSLLLGFVFSVLIMLLVYFDSWDHHLLVLTPILILMMFNLPRQSEITRKYVKPSFFFLSFLDLAFMGLWFLIQRWFPFNFESTIFLMLTFIGLCKYCISDNPQKREV